MLRSAHVECALFVTLFRALHEAIREDGDQPRPDDTTTASAAQRVDDLCSRLFSEVVTSSTQADYRCWLRTTQELATGLLVSDAFSARQPQRRPRGIRFIQRVVGIRGSDPAAEAETQASARLTRSTLIKYQRLCSYVSTWQPNTPDSFDHTIRMLLAGDVMSAAHEAVQLWGRSDRVAISRGLKLVVDQTNRYLPTGLAGVGVGLRTVATLGEDGAAEVWILWTLDHNVRRNNMNRTIGDFLLLSCVGLRHEIVCHVLDEGEVVEKTPLHGWMTFVQLASQLDEDYLGDLPLHWARNKALPQPNAWLQNEEVPPFLDSSELDAESGGWCAAKCWYDRLSAILAGMNEAELVLPVNCEHPTALSPCYILDMLTRWAVRTKDGETTLMCDFSGAKLQPGDECCRLQAVGRSLRRTALHIEDAYRLFDAAEKTLGLDLKHWKDGWYGHRQGMA